MKSGVFAGGSLTGVFIIYLWIFFYNFLKQNSRGKKLFKTPIFFLLFLISLALVSHSLHFAMIYKQRMEKKIDKIMDIFSLIIDMVKNYTSRLSDYPLIKSSNFRVLIIMRLI